MDLKLIEVALGGGRNPEKDEICMDFISSLACFQQS